MDWLSGTFIFLIALVIVTTFILYKSGAEKNVPYFNTFELHYTVAVMGLLTIMLLAHLDVLDKGNVATLFGSLIAYVLGASTGKYSGKTSSNANQTIPSGMGSGGNGSQSSAAGNSTPAPLPGQTMSSTNS